MKTRNLSLLLAALSLFGFSAGGEQLTLPAKKAGPKG
jgi:hypothetical protein